uniref:Uncharacterized protein n=1 Tax=Theropithecus gelada TaxID=9565 RepID=A0A8D2GM39_THEGE
GSVRKTRTVTIGRCPVSTSQSRNIGLLTLGQLQNCANGQSSFLLTEHLLGVRHGAICFPWGLPSGS